MAAQWPLQSQQFHQYHEPQQYQQFSQHQGAQQYQQPQFQATPQFSQGNQYAQGVPQQYQQPTQQFPQNQPYQQTPLPPHQSQAYQHQGTYSQTQPIQQQEQYTQDQQYSNAAQYSQVNQQQSYTSQYPQAQTYEQQNQQYTLNPSYQQNSQYAQAQQNLQNGQHPHAQAYQQPPQQYSQVQYPPQQYSQAQQPPQQYPQAQQSAYNSHQPQYVAEHHSVQQYPPQQHTPGYSNAGQQPYQYQADPKITHGSRPVAPSSCFNCGAPNHFAQDCPESKRPIPAGKLDPHRYSNPLKRSKPGIAIITRFSPPQNSQVQGYSQRYPPPTYGQSTHTQFQGSCSTATPSAAQSQNQAWQQYYQWQAHQQHHQPQQHPGGSQQPQFTHNQQSTFYQVSFPQPTGALSQAPQASTTSSPYYAGQMQAHQASKADAESAQYGPQPAHGAKADKSGQYQHVTLAASTDTLSNLQSSQKDQEETEGDDLELLDVPDLPVCNQEYAESTYLPNTLVSPPASLISMPLPANFVVADALYPIPPPEPEDGGCCRSKYFRDVNLQILYGHITDSKYWKDHKEDTVFLDRPGEDTIVRIEEIQDQLKQRHEYGEGKDDFNRQSRSQSRGLPGLKDSINVSTKVEKLEREIAEMKERVRQKSLAKGKQVSPTIKQEEALLDDRHITLKKEQSTPPRATMVHYEKKPENNDTEDLLVSLGVTGSPKPVVAAFRSYNSLETHDFNLDESQKGYTIHKDKFAAYASENRIPPPPPFPPPPPEQSSEPEVTNGSQTSPGISHTNDHAFSTNGADHLNGNHSTGPDGETLSPDDLRYEDSRNRKRSYTRRDSSSDEDDAPARRQEDDFTPKLKRRQPKVAAAYSRRW